MKKWILWIMAGLVVLPMVSLAQNIGDIDVSFCNSWIQNDNYFTLVTEAGKTDNICVNIRNYSQEPVSIHIDFVDWGISDWWESACLAPDHPMKEFSKYISDNNEDLILQWWEDITKNYELKYPIWFSGLSHGCISYYINSDENNGWVSMVFRKVNRIDVLVWWTEVSSKIKIKDVFYTWDIYENKLWFSIENDWNIDQEVTITWFISWWFGYWEDFDLWSFKLGAGESNLLYTNDLHIPQHKWKFFANSYISNEPSVDFSIAHSNIYDNEYSVAWTTFVQFPFFLWNWLFIVFIVLALLLIFVVIWRISKVKKASNLTKLKKKY